MNKLLIVSGFGWSGSGLLIDVLSSTDNWKKFPVEFRLIKDKGGIIDLINCTEDCARPFNYSIELENFENLCKVLARSNGIRFGMNYDKFTNNQFSKASNNFINLLKMNHYNSDAFVFQYNNNLLLDFCWKILRKLKTKITLKKKYLPLSSSMLKLEIFNFFAKYEKIGILLYISRIETSSCVQKVAFGIVRTTRGIFSRSKLESLSR